MIFEKYNLKNHNMIYSNLFIYQTNRNFDGIAYDSLKIHKAGNSGISLI